jgi:hypothetical protein
MLVVDFDPKTGMYVVSALSAMYLEGGEYEEFLTKMGEYPTEQEAYDACPGLQYKLDR